MAKPSDVFLGITDLFSIILPGAAIAYVCVKVEQHTGGDILGLRSLGHSNEGYVAFFGASYLMGHVMDMAGALFLDDLYDLTYANWKKRREKISFKEWVRQTPKRLAWEIGEKKKRLVGGAEEPEPDGPAREELRRMKELARPKDAMLLEAERLATPEMPRSDRVYQWCRSWIGLKSPAGFAETERLQANSKFFRGIVMASLITAAVSAWTGAPFHLLGASVCVVLALLFFLRFCDLRWKAVQQTYRFFIALRTEPPINPSATPVVPQAREDD